MSKVEFPATPLVSDVLGAEEGSKDEELDGVAMVLSTFLHRQLQCDTNLNPAVWSRTPGISWSRNISKYHDGQTGA